MIFIKNERKLLALYMVKMAFKHQMDFVKRSYESLVYIPVEEKLSDSNTWLNSLLSWWDITNPDIEWCLKGGNPFVEKKDQSTVQQVD